VLQTDYTTVSLSLLSRTGWPLTSRVRILSSLPSQCKWAIRSQALLDQSLPNFSRRIFFIKGVNATIRVAIRPPVFDW